MDRFWARVVVEPLPRRSTPHPDVLVIDVRPEGVYLSGYTIDGEFAGDTWHESTDDAKHQAEYQYGHGIEWMPVPDDEHDAVAYAVKTAALSQ